MFSFSKAPDWETDGAAWPHRATSQFIEAGDYRWHVQRMGAGPGLVLIHGTGAATHSWSGLMPLLAASFDVVAFDLPGHGFTATRRWSPPSLGHVAQQAGILLGAINFAPSVIVGHSAGAAIMIEVIRSHPIAPDAAISINGALSPFGGPAGFLFPAMAKLLYYNPLTAYSFAQGARDIGRVRRLIEGTGSVISEDGVERYASLMRRPGHIAGALGLMAHWDLTQMDRAVGALKVPFLSVAGENDRAVPPTEAEKAAALAPDGRAVLMPGLGHLAHEEAPTRIADVVKKFAPDTDIDIES